MKFLSIGDVADISGANVKTIDDWVRRGLLRPTIPTRGRGRPGLWSPAQTLAVSLSQWMRSDPRFNSRAANNVMRVLAAYTDAALQANLLAGRTHLMVLNDNCAPVLMTAEALTDNPELLAMAQEGRDAGLRVDLYFVDVAAAMATVRAKISELEAATRRPHAQEQEQTA